MYAAMLQLEDPAAKGMENSKSRKSNRTDAGPGTYSVEASRETGIISLQAQEERPPLLPQLREVGPLFPGEVQIDSTHHRVLDKH